MLLGQAGATAVQSGGVWRVVPSAGSIAGSVVVPLRYASAEALARLLQPFAGNAARVAAEPARNALLIAGEPNAREALIELAQTFDVNALAGQSYALLPVPPGTAKDFAAAMQDLFRGQGKGALAGLVRLVPLDRIDAVLLAAAQPRYLDDARRVFALVERERRFAVRSWHVYYLQNSHANDVANLLQQAFTPEQRHRPAEQRDAMPRGPAEWPAAMAGRRWRWAAGARCRAAPCRRRGRHGRNGRTGSGRRRDARPGRPRCRPAAPVAPVNPLLGGLGGGGGGNPDAMRIIPNPQNNAVVVYATSQEAGTVEAMLRKIDILPLQVRIDAVIAEVTLNDALQYGTQFFFKQGDLNQALARAGDGGQRGPGRVPDRLGRPPTPAWRSRRCRR